jgi:hypothetical protein
MEEDQIIGLWDVFKEYIPEKNKEAAANHFVDFLVGQDVESSVLQSIVGYDSNLDDAIDLVLGDEAEESEEDEDNYGYDEDEDY